MSGLEQKIKKSTLQLRAEHILKAINAISPPNGPPILPKTGAAALASRGEGICALLEQEYLPPNPMPRPPFIIPINGKVNPKEITIHYREKAAKHVNFWIQGINPDYPPLDTAMSWTTYQALIIYCESKVRQLSTEVTA